MRPYDDKIGFIGLKGTVAGGGDRRRHIYGYHIDSGESDPSAAVTYLEDAVGASPAYMDFANDYFVWGSWRDAFFLPRPCMLKYDGTVDYYLDPNDYTKKADGSASDVADDTYGGNAMMEWGQGGKKIWYKIVPDAGDDTSASVYIADYRVDADYRCWSFINNQGHMVDHFYTPIYNGSIDSGGRLRSISGKPYSALCQNKTVDQEVAAAELNNPGTDKLWYTEVMADVTLINLLLILMGKSLNTQAVFGNGVQGQEAAASSMIGTGTMDSKGLFWGASDDTHGVKVLGMENWFGNLWRRYAGHILDRYTHKVKLTRGTQDGSTASDYNTTGSGYLGAGSAPQVQEFVTKMRFTGGTLVTAAASGGSDTTFWCDYWYPSSDTTYALRGGYCDTSVGRGGAFGVALTRTASSTVWYFGASPSLKPPLREGGF